MTRLRFCTTESPAPLPAADRPSPLMVEEILSRKKQDEKGKESEGRTVRHMLWQGHESPGQRVQDTGPRRGWLARDSRSACREEDDRNETPDLRAAKFLRFPGGDKNTRSHRHKLTATVRTLLARRSFFRKTNRNYQVRVVQPFDFRFAIDVTLIITDSQT